MKPYLTRLVLCCVFLTSPLLANDEKAPNPIQNLETSVLSKKVPQGYEKAYAYRLNGEYVSRYDKSLPGGKDPYDSYVITIDIDSVTLKNVEHIYRKHQTLDNKKCLSEKEALKRAMTILKDHDSLTLTLVDTQKITPYQAEPSQKTGLRYAYVITNDIGENHQILYLDAYDGDILGLDSYHTINRQEVPQEPESVFLNLWEAIKRFFGQA